MSITPASTTTIESSIGGAMLGHEYRLSETNVHGWVFVCECGEIGKVHELAGYTGDDTIGKRARIELARQSAVREHGRHLELVREATARAHAVALDARAGYVAAVRPTVTRLGRWGNG